MDLAIGFPDVVELFEGCKVYEVFGLGYASPEVDDEVRAPCDGFSPFKLLRRPRASFRVPGLWTFTLGTRFIGRSS